MTETKSMFTKIAAETIERFLKKGDVDELRNRTVLTELSKAQGCFVSLHKKDGSLRGCIGTIAPVEDNLQNEIISNAISAATRDTRFSPLTIDELDDLEISVDVLSVPEKINSIDELDPKKYGIIISDSFYHRAVLLPNLEGVDTVERQIEITKRKAGLQNYNTHQLEIKRFTSTRYY